MSTHPDPRARKRPAFRLWMLVGATAALAAGALVLFALQVTPDERTETPSPTTTVSPGARTPAQRARSVAGTDPGPENNNGRQPGEADRPAPRDLMHPELRMMFAAPHLRPDEIARVREFAARATMPADCAIAAAILSKHGDQEAMDRLVGLAAKGAAWGIVCLDELQPTRAMVILRLARWTDGAGADKASRVLATLLRRPGDGEAALAAALRDAAPDELPRWMEVIAGYTVVPRTVAMVLLEFLSSGSAAQRDAFREFCRRSPKPLQEVVDVVAARVEDLAGRATDSDIIAVLQLAGFACKSGAGIGRGLLVLSLRSRSDDVPSSDKRWAVTSWMANGWPDVAAIPAERTQAILEALRGPGAASFLLGVVLGDDRNETLFVCQRVLPEGTYDATTFARPLLALAGREDKEIAAVAASALERLRAWPPDLARSTAGDLRRLVEDRRGPVSLRAAHALPSVPDSEEAVREVLWHVSELPEDGPILSSLLDGLLDNPRLLSDQAIAGRVMSLFASERAEITIPVRRRIIAWVFEREEGPVSAAASAVARSVFPFRRRAECAEWMRDAEIRIRALAILNRLEVPTVADAVAACWAARDPTVTGRASNMIHRREWINAMERMPRADQERFNVLEW